MMAFSRTTFVGFHMITEDFHREICNLQELENNVDISQATENSGFSSFENIFEFLSCFFGCYLRFNSATCEVLWA